jgi:hypothetical protein
MFFRQVWLYSEAMAHLGVCDILRGVPMKDSRLKASLVVIVAVALVIVWLPLRKHVTHRMSLTTYFRNGLGLQPGASVRVDGVDIGSVTSVRVRPELGERPVEVLMAIATSYDLAIPKDSIASLATAGVLGPTFVDIDTRHAQGVRAESNSVLKSSEITDEEANRALQVVGNAVKRFGDALTEAPTKSVPANRPPDSDGKPNQSTTK